MTTVTKRPHPVAIWIIGLGELAAFLNAPLFYSVISRLYGYDEVAVGYVAAAEVLGITIGAGALALVPAARHETVLALACALVALGNFLCPSLGGSLAVLIGLRAIVGIGAGLARGYVYRYCGTAPSPNKAFGAFYATQIGISAPGYPFLHWLTAGYGGTAIFWFYGALGVASFAIALTLPRGWVTRKPEPRSEITPVGTRLLTPAILLGLLGLTLHGWSSGNTWPFLQKFGEQHGFADVPLNNTMSAAAAVGVIGSLLAVVTPQRFARWGVLGVGSVVLLLAGWGLYQPGSFAEYAAGAIAVGLYYMYALPMLLDAISRRDPSGRVTVIAGSVCLIGYMLGSAVGGHVIERFGYSTLGPTIVAFCTVAAVLVYFPFNRRQE